MVASNRTMVAESMQVSARGIFPLVLQRTFVLAALEDGRRPRARPGARAPVGRRPELGRPGLPPNVSPSACGNLTRRTGSTGAGGSPTPLRVLLAVPWPASAADTIRLEVGTKEVNGRVYPRRTRCSVRPGWTSRGPGRKRSGSIPTVNCWQRVGAEVGRTAARCLPTHWLPSRRRTGGPPRIGRRETSTTGVAGYPRAVRRGQGRRVVRRRRGGTGARTPFARDWQGWSGVFERRQ